MTKSQKNQNPAVSATLNNKIIADQLAMLSGFQNQHPLIQSDQGSGMLDSLYELQQSIAEYTDQVSISFSSEDIDTGLFSVIAMIKAWHLGQSNSAKTEFAFMGDVTQLKPVAAHIEFELITPRRAITSLDRAWARLNCGDNTAAFFLFPPRGTDFSIADVAWIIDRVHYCGGLIVADSNICRLIKQSETELDEPIDLYLLDLAELFELPRASSEADSFALAAGEQMAPFLPMPRLIVDESVVRWSDDDEYPFSIGRTGIFGANRFNLLSLAIELQLGSNDAGAAKA